ncbi:helix-turn-helix domain-containing protein [Streptomyces sp. NPDC050803]|uniref:helix-turn-helix domain-containing protein n=1 Tax=unclassified Streptomyces TaxID=2593676 RepID=UPI00342951BF
MSAPDDVARFAESLRELKDRTDRSYGSLARRLGMNTSTLHRYCAGDAVPQDYAPVERFAALCGASAEERMELHRRWLLAVAARQRPRAAAAPQPADPPEEPADATPEPEREPEPAPPGRPWYRRRRTTVAAAVASVLLATLGTLSALDTGPGDRTADDPARGAGTPRTTAPGPTKSPLPPSPTTTEPSPSDGSTAKPSRTPEAEESSGAPSAQGEPVAGAPLTWTADSQVWAQGCGHDYVIARPPAQVPPPPAPQDAGSWAAAEGAVHGRETMVRISVQGRTSTAVVLEALRVRVVGRSAPAEGNAYAMDQGCGGAVTPRYFDVDLDIDRPLARPVDGNDSGTTIPAMRLPYRVSAEDPEVLLVSARTGGCDCRWYLELDWSSQGRTGTVTIGDDGRPFRTTAIEGLPRYGYDTATRQWGPYNP